MLWTTDVNLNFVRNVNLRKAVCTVKKKKKDLYLSYTPMKTYSTCL